MSWRAGGVSDRKSVAPGSPGTKGIPRFAVPGAGAGGKLFCIPTRPEYTAVLIFDAHLDLALNAVDWNRDLRMTVPEIRAQEVTHNMTDPGRRTNTVSFPELKQARVGLGVATVIARQERQIN